MAGKDEEPSKFTKLYLKQATKEFAGDLDQVRKGDDFAKADALPMLIKALSQGAALYSPAEQERILEASKGSGERKEAAAASEDGHAGDQEMTDA